MQVQKKPQKPNQFLIKISALLHVYLSLSFLCLLYTQMLYNCWSFLKSEDCNIQSKARRRLPTLSPRHLPANTPTKKSTQALALLMV